jgi:hypothetical protein
MRTVRQNDRQNEDSCTHLSSAGTSGSRLSHQSALSLVASRSRCTSRIGGTRDVAFVLPIEVGGVVVAHAIGGTCRVKVFAQHQTASELSPQPLLKLQGTHRRDGFLRGDATPRRSCPVLARAARWEVASQSFDGAVQQLWRCGGCSHPGPQGGRADHPSRSLLRRLCDKKCWWR